MLMGDRARAVGSHIDPLMLSDDHTHNIHHTYICTYIHTSGERQASVQPPPPVLHGKHRRHHYHRHQLSHRIYSLLHSFHFLQTTREAPLRGRLEPHDSVSKTTATATAMTTIMTTNTTTAHHPR